MGPLRLTNVSRQHVLLPVCVYSSPMFRLAVVPVVDSQNRAQPETPPVHRADLHACSAQAPQVPCRQLVGPHLIVDDVDLQPGPGFFFEHVAQRGTYAVIPDDEELHQNGMPRFAQGAEQVAVGIITILKNPDTVSGAGGVAGAAAEGAVQPRAARFPGALCFQESLDAVPAVAACGVAVDARGPQQQIERNGDDRQQEKTQHPGNGALR